jgi:hypothetical protein
VRIPTFSRQSEPDTTEAGRPTTTATGTATDAAPVRPRHGDDTTEVRPPADRPLPPPGATNQPGATDRPLPPPRRAEQRVDTGGDHRADAGVDHRGDATVADRPAVTGPKPRASLLATLGLILGVVAVLLVLSGPLLGYGIGVGVLALLLSLSGIHATGRRHVAGKTDALIGMVLALGAIVLGVLALTGSLSWLGTDAPTVNNLREWLDAQFVDRFAG